MDTDKKAALHVLLTSIALGLFGGFLFSEASAGLNIFFWTVALTVGALLVCRWIGRPLPKLAQVAGPILLVFASCFAFRDSVELKWANGLAMFLIVGAVLVRMRHGSLRNSTIYDLTLRAVGAWFKLTADFANLVVKEVQWTASAESNARARGIFRGLAIAFPLLLLFGALFMSADQQFESMIRRGFSFDWLDGDWLFQTALIFSFCTVMAAGVYKVILRGENKAEENEALAAAEPKLPFTLAFTEVAVVFGLLDTLFGLFVFVQIRYLFGGAQQIHSVPGLTYTEYARHGFFELTAVATAAVATILGFHSLLKDPPASRRGFSIVAGTLAALVAVVLASALKRMFLYIDFAGLTELRVYTTAFMVWVGIVLTLLVPTVLRGRRMQFAFGALAAGLGGIFALNIVNPDAMIARYDLAMNKTPDLAYLSTLSMDAAPVIAGAPAKSGTVGSGVSLKDALQTKWAHEADHDWRGINYGRWRFLTDLKSKL